MRYRALHAGLPVDRLSPTILIRQLYSQGELSLTQFDAALDSQSVRNRVVHGFSASNLTGAVTRLGAIVRELLDEWSGPAA